MVILGGVNGAGKSTLAAQVMRLRGLRGIAFLNPDVASLDAMIATPGISPTAANLVGLRAIARRIAAHLNEGRSFVSETVLANATYQRLCGTAHDRGWLVRLFYVG